MGKIRISKAIVRAHVVTLVALGLLGAPRSSVAQTPVEASPPAAPAAEPAPPPAPAASCVPDCRSGFVCVQGTCVSACNPPCAAHEECTGAGACVAKPAPPAQSAPPPQAPPAAPSVQSPVTPASPAYPPSSSEYADPSRRQEPESPSANSHVNVHVNALGFLQFGLVPAIEFGGRNFGFSGRLRLMTTGVLSHAVAADSGEDEEFASGLGLGAAARYYSGKGGNMRGFYVGGGLEYVTTRVEDTTDDREAYVTKAIIPEFDIGYRWVWGSFLLGLGGIGGYMLVQSATTEDLSNGQDEILYPNTAEDTLYVMGVLDLGFFF